MKGILTFCCLIALSLPLAALEDGHAAYVGGTLPGVNPGIVGRVETTWETSLIFRYAGSEVTIPYASIESYEYSREVKRHLGVLPAIVVRLLRARQRRHYFRISYRDQSVTQVAIFEVPKQTPRTLEAVLQTRAPGTCKPSYSSSPSH
jgi:hypothetical protein